MAQVLEKTSRKQRARLTNQRKGEVIAEVVAALSEDKRTLQTVKDALKRRGVVATDTTIYARLKAARHGAASANDVGLLQRIDVVRRAAKKCGGIANLKQAIEFVERVRSQDF